LKLARIGISSLQEEGFPIPITYSKYLAFRSIAQGYLLSHLHADHASVDETTCSSNVLPFIWKIIYELDIER
jgi:hypothetical protein